VFVVVCEVGERTLDRPAVVAQHHRSIGYTAHLALQAVGGLLGRVERVVPRGVRR
jgi:hypothetical protein